MRESAMVLRPATEPRPKEAVFQPSASGPCEPPKAVNARGRRALACARLEPRSEDGADAPCALKPALPARLQQGARDDRCRTATVRERTLRGRL